MVLPGFEPDLYVTEMKKGKPNDKYKGTPEEYRLAFRRFYDVFRDQGVENAVWALDYSWDIQFDPDLAVDLWPGEIVDWLFFHVYQFR